jgi:L,D-transpeptidase YcbB
MAAAFNTGLTLAGAALCLCLASLAPGVATRADAQNVAPIDEMAALIRDRIEGSSAREDASFMVGGERLHAATELPRFYRGRGFTPAWVDELGPRPLADSALWAVEGAVLEGLESSHYHLARIRDVYADVRRARLASGRVDPARLAELDLLLTDAFLLYASHLAAGRVDPTTIHPAWTASVRSVDLVAELDMALATGRVGGVLEGLLPAHPAYARLRDVLADYRRVAGRGGWPELPGRTLEPGMRDPAVALLRQRLRLSGDLAPARPDSYEQFYDAEVEAAVRRFQERHGMEANGVVGLPTSGLMNVPVEDRIRQIELSMERWRWLPRDLGDRHILVNIAGMDMDVMQGDSSIFHSRVLVGQRYRKTPVFSDRMTYLVINPTWTIPPGILEEDKLPLIREDPDYLARNNIQVLASDGRVVDPSAIDFTAMTGRTALRFRMDPGPENPLGMVKFMFPNPHHIYLHDTPDHEDFDRPGGAISSGCIRVERALDLAEYLLADLPGWDRPRLDGMLGRPGERTIPLRQPLPIHILYWTAWVDPDGAAHFRPDIYERDEALAEALLRPPPAAATAGSHDSASQDTLP